MAIAQQLLSVRNLLDPEPQRLVLHDYILAISDDPARADVLVPEQPLKVSDSVHDAQIVAGVLMQGLPVAIKTGMNHIEYVEALMASMAVIIQRISQQGGVGTMPELMGLQNIAQHIGQHIQIIAQDPNEKSRVKQYGDQMGKLMNLVKAFMQRLQEQMQQQAQQNGNGDDQETMAKIKAMLMTAEAKAANTRESHAQRTAQREIQFELEQKRKQADHALTLQTDAARAQLDIQTTAAKADIDLAKERAKLEAQARKSENDSDSG